ncbi:hypothetical protein Patl1_15756 [Pistacia atlantica]|uniref:Uncharacterized protein n=1 Tax=Pistacia atlantica TaxID=434234 RepID=A0ACC1B870_9ROSI|nr:hypothetical protein Patl1_15756 [Pistacia atlantica]
MVHCLHPLTLKKSQTCLLSPLASFNFSLLFSLGKPFTGTSQALKPFNSEATIPDATVAAKEETGVPESCSFFLVKSRVDDDPRPEATVPDATVAAKEVTGVPESCSFFLIKSRVDNDPGPKVLRVVASCPPVLTAGALKAVGANAFSIVMLVLGTDVK